MHKQIRSISFIAMLTLLCTFWIGCSGSSNALNPKASEGFNINAALDELEALSTPDGVDQTRWQEIKQTLRSLLVGRSASSAELGENTLVSDLASTKVGSNKHLTWTYRNAGDYNQDGLVAATDLTPLGMYFGATSADETWNKAQIADGNVDGIISVQDITPIGQFYSVRITGYMIEFTNSPDDETSWSSVTTIPLNNGEHIESDNYTRFSWTITSAISGFYRVRAVDESQEPILIGSPSQYINYSPPRWTRTGGNCRNTFNSSNIGPETLGVNWEIGTPSMKPVFALGNGDLLLTGYEEIITLSPDGVIDSRFDCKNANNLQLRSDDTLVDYRNAEILQLDGSVVSEFDRPPTTMYYMNNQDQSFGWDNYTNNILAYDAELNEIWTYQLENNGSGLLVCSDSMVCTVQGTFSALIITAIDMTGSKVWSKRLDAPIADIYGVALNKDDDLYVSYAYYSDSTYIPVDHCIQVYKSDGDELWSWTEELKYAKSNMSITDENEVYSVTGNAEIVKLSSDGSLLWRTELTDLRVNYPFMRVGVNIATDQIGKLYVSYSSYSINTFGDQGCIVVFDPDGVELDRLKMGYDSLACSFSFDTSGNLITTSSMSITSFGDTGSTPPIAPRNLRASTDLYGGIKLAWEPSANAESYTVYRAADDFVVGETTQLQLDDDGVLTSEPIGYYVRAYNKFGMSKPSPVVEGQMLSYSGREDFGPADWSMAGCGPGNTRQSSQDLSHTLWSQSSLHKSSTAQISEVVFDNQGGCYYTDSEGYFYIKLPTYSKRFKIPSRKLSSPAIGHNGTKFVSAIETVLIDHSVYFVQKLYAIKNDQTSPWSIELNVTDNSLSAPDPVISPTGDILVGGEAIYCVSPEGEVLWQHENGLVARSPVVSSNGVVFVVTGKNYPATEHSVSQGPGPDPPSVSLGIRAFSPTGIQKWANESTDYGYNLVCDSNDYLYATDSNSIVRLNPSDGTEVWRQDFESTISKTAVGDHGLLYTRGMDKKLYALNIFTSNIEWTADLLVGNVNQTPFIDNNGQVFVLDAYGLALRCFSVNGDEYSSYSTDLTINEYTASPSVSPDGKVFISGSGAKTLILSPVI